MYHKFGLVNAPYWNYTKSTIHDEGRFVVTANPMDKQYFKVASLRNVAKTYPYFHDGSVEKLEDAVIIMAKTQLDKDLDEYQVKSLIAFLNTLTGDIPNHVY
jgi:cytochrome c peroxidase